ncbi:MAG: dihydroorotate dehydrogenase [Dehalococcoidia bacterium]|nr:dihydroorotate dehydrogenase [Dehalococcoidia bacterium]HRC61971.1 dihydroorotate dehydrogenase [Dehalococcoidia bacterium]
MAHVDLSVTLAAGQKQELRLRNPVMVASGTFSNGIEFAKRFDVDELGAIVSKGTTLRPRRGNPVPRTVETPSGMINSIGFQNVGVGTLVSEVAPVWARWQAPVLVNIMGETLAEYGQLAQRLDGVPGVAGLEVNISCPNVEAGGLEFGQDPLLAADVTREVRRHTALPMSVKVTPGVTDLRPIVAAVSDAGADAITVMNTVPAMAIDVRARRPVLATAFGGLSGPAVKPIALRLVYLAASVTNLPILAAGGVSSGLDAVEFLMAGASAIQVGTATFRDPQAPWKVLAELREWCEREGVSSIGEIVGVARRRD